MSQTTILVIRSSAMGDVAMTVPVLRAFEQRYGDRVKVVMLTRDFYDPFFDGIKNLEMYNIDLYDQHSGVNGVRKIYKELRAAYKFDMVVDLNYKLYSRLLRRFFMFGGVKAFSIDKGREEKKELTRFKGKRLHQLRSSIERYADVFRKAGFALDVANVLPEKRAWEGEDKHVRWVGISPFAKHTGKVLPIESVRQVIEGLTREEPGVIIFIFGGGRADRMVADSLVAWYDNCVSTIGTMSLRGELDLMRRLDVMLSMDSSAMHMCSLVGTRVVSVWGATHPFAGFLGWGQSMDDVVEVDDLNCRPCSVYGHKPCFRGDYACLTRITPASIISKLM